MCSPPAIFLTARDALAERLAGFSAGGDACLTKPFRFDELVARAARRGPRARWCRETTLDPYVARLRRKLYQVSARAAIETAHDVRCRLG